MSPREGGEVIVIPGAAVAEHRPTNGSARDEPALAGLVALRLDEFLQKEIKDRGMVLDPIIPEQGLVLLYSWRGIGKTHVSLGIAYAVAAGAKFLKWKAPKPRRVLFVDGEMPARTLQQRLVAVVRGTNEDAPPENLKIITPDMQPLGLMHNLASAEGQAAVERWIAAGTLEQCDLVVLDNISTLCGSAKDNDVESWLPVQSWLLSLRRRGVAVLLVHHAGKGGAQRGTSSREDILDTSIELLRPADYSGREGARFEVHLKKARGIIGDAAEPFEAVLTEDAGRAVWTLKELAGANQARAFEMFAMGMKPAEVAVEVGVGRATAYRWKKDYENRPAEGGSDDV